MLAAPQGVMGYPGKAVETLRRVALTEHMKFVMRGQGAAQI